MTQQRAWEQVVLGDLGTWFGGGTPSKGNRAFWEGGSIPWLSPKDMGRDVLADTADHISDAAVAGSSVRLVPADSVAVVVRSGILERVLPVARVPFETTLNQDMKAVVPRRGIDPRWVAWGLRAMERDVLDNCRKAGTTVASIETSRFMALTLPVPPIEEQRRIVDILEDHLSRLDAADNYLDRLENRLQVLERSTILARVTGADADLGDVVPGVRRQLPPGWAWMPWSEVGTSQNGKAFPSNEYQDHGVRLIRPGNLAKDGTFTWTQANTKHMPMTYAEANPTYLVGPDELIMNLTAQSLKDDFLGRICMTGAETTALLNQRLARLSPVRLHPRFAFYVFRSPLFRAYVSSLNTGSLIQHMFTKQIASFEVPVPPLSEQEAIARDLDALLRWLRRLQSEVGQAHARGHSLRQSLLAAAFSGQLTSSLQAAAEETSHV